MRVRSEGKLRAAVRACSGWPGAGALESSALRPRRCWRRAADTAVARL